MALGNPPPLGERVQINVEEYGPYNQLRYLSSQLDDALVEPGSQVDADRRRWARQQLSEISYARQLLLRPHATEEFILDYIEAENERFDRGDREATPYSGARQRDRCGCTRGTACPLRKGKLFREVRERDDTAAAIRQVKQEHPNPILLIEAQRQLLRLRAWVTTSLQHILLHVRSDVPAEDLPAELPSAADDLQSLSHVPP